jgi:hypothetical protein
MVAHRGHHAVEQNSGIPGPNGRSSHGTHCRRTWEEARGRDRSRKATRAASATSGNVRSTSGTPSASVSTRAPHMMMRSPGSSRSGSSRTMHAQCLRSKKDRGQVRSGTCDGATDTHTHTHTHTQRVRPTWPREDRCAAGPHWLLRSPPPNLGPPSTSQPPRPWVRAGRDVPGGAMRRAAAERRGPLKTEYGETVRSADVVCTAKASLRWYGSPRGTTERSCTRPSKHQCMRP